METSPPVKRTRTAWAPGQSGNPKGRPPGIAQVRKLLDPHRDELVQKAVALALAGDTVALRLCIDRLAPLPRAEFSPVVIPGIALAVSMSDKARAILDAAGGAVISPDAAAMLLSAIASVAKIIEADELAARIAALEADRLV